MIHMVDLVGTLAYHQKTETHHVSDVPICFIVIIWEKNYRWKYSQPWVMPQNFYSTRSNFRTVPHGYSYRRIVSTWLEGISSQRDFFHISHQVFQPNYCKFRGRRLLSFCSVSVCTHNCASLSRLPAFLGEQREGWSKMIFAVPMQENNKWM